MANLIVIVGFMVTATSGLPDDEQGLGTGLATMSQQVGITMGIPIMSAITAAQLSTRDDVTSQDVLAGISVAITVNAALCLATALVLAIALPRRTAVR